MKWSFRILLTAVLLAGLLSACSGEVGTKLEGEALDDALAYVDPITENLLEGLQTKDYATFSQDFNDEMLKGIDATKFDALYKQLDDQIGAYQSHGNPTVTDFGKMVTAEYESQFAKTDKVKIVVTVTKEEPHQVTGLYFR